MNSIILVNTSADVPSEYLPATPALRPALRQLWWLQAGDAFVSPLALPEDFVQYVLTTLGISRDEVLLLVDETACVRADSGLSSANLASLRAWMGRAAKWQINAAVSTPAVTHLARSLAITDATGGRLGLEGCNELLNRKASFRRLATGLGVPLAEGAVAGSAATLELAVNQFISITGSVIVKADNAGGGYGNVVITDQQERSRHRGAMRTAYRGQLDYQSLWRDLTTERDNVVVIEAYHDSVHAWYHELFVDAAGAVRSVGSGDILLDEGSDASQFHWTGLELPASAPQGAQHQALVEAVRLAAAASSLGYRGHINVDAVLTDSGRLIVNEVNARWGGGTVLDTVARRMLGDSYADTHTLRWHRDAPGLAVSRLAGAITFTELREGEGLLVLATDPSQPTGGELVAWSRDSRRLDRLLSSAIAAIRQDLDATSEPTDR